MPADRVLPTLDEAEWASGMWGPAQEKEKAEDNLQKLMELHEEELSALKPYQIEMTRQFWALTSMGMKMPEEKEEDEEWGTWGPWHWHWNEWWPGEGEWWEPGWGSQWNWKENGSNE
jgi:hypothetical protein